MSWSYDGNPRSRNTAWWRFDKWTNQSWIAKCDFLSERFVGVKVLFVLTFLNHWYGMLYTWNGKHARTCISSILSPSLSVYRVGTRARQRSRYLRFARPPQEKQLIAARKRTIKEKKFLKLSAEVGVVALLLLLLCTIVFRKFVWCHPFIWLQFDFQLSCLFWHVLDCIEPV